MQGKNKIRDSKLVNRNALTHAGIHSEGDEKNGRGMNGKLKIRVAAKLMSLRDEKTPFHLGTKRGKRKEKASSLVNIV